MNKYNIMASFVESNYVIFRANITKDKLGLLEALKHAAILLKSGVHDCRVLSNYHMRRRTSFNFCFGALWQLVVTWHVGHVSTCTLHALSQHNLVGHSVLISWAISCHSRHTYWLKGPTLRIEGIYSQVSKVPGSMQPYTLMNILQLRTLVEQFPSRLKLGQARMLWCGF